MGDVAVFGLRDGKVFAKIVDSYPGREVFGFDQIKNVDFVFDEIHRCNLHSPVIRIYNVEYIQDSIDEIFTNACMDELDYVYIDIDDEDRVIDIIKSVMPWLSKGGTVKYVKG